MTSRSDMTPDEGFTLIEMMVVIAIMGLMLVLVTAGSTAVSPAIHARISAETISAALRAARSEAVMRNRSVDFTLDLARRSYRLGNAGADVLPGDLSLALLTSEDDAMPRNVGHIRFNPDGSSSGGRVALSGGGRTWWVGVDWLSGQVSVVEKPR